MKAIIALVLIIALFVTATTLTGCYQDQEIVLILCFDISASAQDLEAKIRDWTLRFFGQSDPDSELTVCQLSTECVPVIYMMKGLPQPDDVVSGDFREFYTPGQEKGTRPLRFLEYALAEARKYPDKLFVVCFFTDGENDFPGDNQALETVCQNLVMQENVIQIGFLGLEPLDNRNVPDWSGWFGTSDKVIIATCKLNCTDQAIDQLCTKARELQKTFSEKTDKGGK